MTGVTKLSDLPEEQQGQHRAVLKVAAFNLSTLIDQLQTLDSASYDEILEYLDGAKEAMEQKQAILEKLRNA